MKTFSLAFLGTTLLTVGIASANPLPSLCYFGRSSKGPVASKFEKVKLPNTPRISYRAVLSNDVIATVDISYGHSFSYKLKVTHIPSGVTMVDSYTDFDEIRNLRVEGYIGQEPVSCSFNPKDFGRI